MASAAQARLGRLPGRPVTQRWTGSALTETWASAVEARDRQATVFITKKKKEFKVGTPGTVASTLKKHKELLDDAYVFSGGGVWTVSRVRRGECFKYTHPAIGKDCFSLAEVARHMASKMREQQREDKRNGRSLTPGRGSSSTCPSADATPPPAVEETELVPERWAEQMRATLGDDGRIVTFARNAATVDTAAPGNGVAENSSLEISVQNTRDSLGTDRNMVIIVGETRIGKSQLKNTFIIGGCVDPHTYASHEWQNRRPKDKKHESDEMAEEIIRQEFADDGDQATDETVAHAVETRVKQFYPEKQGYDPKGEKSAFEFIERTVHKPIEKYAFGQKIPPAGLVHIIGVGTGVSTRFNFKLTFGVRPQVLFSTHREEMIMSKMLKFILQEHDFVHKKMDTTKLTDAEQKDRQECFDMWNALVAFDLALGCGDNKGKFGLMAPTAFTSHKMQVRDPGADLIELLRRPEPPTLNDIVLHEHVRDKLGKVIVFKGGGKYLHKDLLHIRDAVLKYTSYEERIVYAYKNVFCFIPDESLIGVEVTDTCGTGDDTPLHRTQLRDAMHSTDYLIAAATHNLAAPNCTINALKDYGMFERAYIHKSIGLSVIHLPEKEIPIGVETFTTGWEERQKTDQMNVQLSRQAIEQVFAELPAFEKYCKDKNMRPADGMAKVTHWLKKEVTVMPVYSLSYASFVNNKKETMAELERIKREAPQGSPVKEITYDMLLERTNGAAFRAFIAGLAMKRAARELRALENGPLANSIAGIEAQVKNVADRPPISEAAKAKLGKRCLQVVGSTEKRRRDPETTASLQLIKGSFGARGEEGTPAAVLRARLEATRAKVIAAAGLVCDAAEEEARAQFKAMRPKLDHCDGPALEALKALKAERASPPLDLKTAFLAPYGLSESFVNERIIHDDDLVPSDEDANSSVLAKARRDLQRVVDKGVTDSINAAADCCAETLKDDAAQWLVTSPGASAISTRAKGWRDRVTEEADAEQLTIQVFSDYLIDNFASHEGAQILREKPLGQCIKNFKTYIKQSLQPSSRRPNNPNHALRKVLLTDELCSGRRGSVVAPPGGVTVAVFIESKLDDLFAALKKSVTECIEIAFANLELSIEAALSPARSNDREVRKSAAGRFYVGAVEAVLAAVLEVDAGERIELLKAVLEEGTEVRELIGNRVRALEALAANKQALTRSADKFVDRLAAYRALAHTSPAGGVALPPLSEANDLKLPQKLRQDFAAGRRKFAGEQADCGDIRGMPAVEKELAKLETDGGCALEVVKQGGHDHACDSLWHALLHVAYNREAAQNPAYAALLRQRVASHILDHYSGRADDGWPARFQQKWGARMEEYVQQLHSGVRSAGMLEVSFAADLLSIQVLVWIARRAAEGGGAAAPSPRLAVPFKAKGKAKDERNAVRPTAFNLVLASSEKQTAGVGGVRHQFLATQRPAQRKAPAALAVQVGGGAGPSFSWAEAAAAIAPNYGKKKRGADGGAGAGAGGEGGNKRAKGK